MLEGSVVPVSRNVRETCDEEWTRLGRPGTWWTGAERVGIADEARAARSCGLCAERKRSLSPSAVRETHDARPLLNADAVDAVHRIVTDPARLTRSWVAGLIGSIDAVRYVELVGIVATLVAVDTLARGIGALPPPLPQPLAGEPDRVTPPGTAVHSAWVPTVVPDDAEGEVAEFYAGLGGPGFVPNIQRALTLVPAEQLGIAHMQGALYLSVQEMFTNFAPDRALGRAQMELVACTVSRLNECFY